LQKRLFYTRTVSRDVGRSFSLALNVRKQTYPSEQLGRAGRIALRVTAKT